MLYRAPIAVYDACVLYPFHLRNILVQCAVDGLVEARWTDDIHTEWISSLAARAHGVTVERLEATRDLMKSVLPEADVVGYHGLIPGLRLPDPDDRHVLASAIASKASVIVTWNLKDFPQSDLSAYGIASQSPDEFLMEIYASIPDALIASIANARRNLRKTAPGVDDFIAEVENQNLRRISSILRQHRNGLG